MGTAKDKPETKDRRDPEKSDKEEPPEDRLFLIYSLFFLLGLVHFLPWSFFTTATQYWMYKFRNTTIEETDSEFRTDLQAEFNAALKITLQVSDIAFLILTLLFGHYIPVRVRKIGVLTIIMVLFAIIMLFVKVDTDSWQAEFFGLIMAISAGINAMNATFSITMFTAIAKFPQTYLAAYLLGGGLSGIFTSGLQICSLTLGLSVQDSALAYFSVGLFVIVFTLMGSILAGRNRFYVYYMSKITDDRNEKIISFKEGFRLFKKIWSSVAMLFFFLLTTDVIPTALVVSEGEGNGPWNDVYFIPTITYLLSAVMGFIGRALSFKFTPRLSPRMWTIIAFARFLIFSPLFMLCNAQPRHHLPVLLPHDYQYIILLITLHLSGGYLMSRGSYNIASLVEPDELKKAYHVNMLFSGINMGLLSFVSIVSVKLI